MNQSRFKSVRKSINMNSLFRTLCISLFLFVDLFANEPVINNSNSSDPLQQQSSTRQTTRTGTPSRYGYANSKPQSHVDLALVSDRMVDAKTGTPRR